jgi:hypothetical protein
VDKILVRYHWDNQPLIEKEINIQPFQYATSINQLFPAPGSLQRLYYELIAISSDGTVVSSDKKEVFYFNSQITGDTYMRIGANLVLGDYTSVEYNKVFKWFISYLKMAKEAQFVPIENKSPYIIFLGTDHDFIKNYQGPDFILYTPAPFSPTITRIPVHRYFLSYWYGPGWKSLDAKELEPLGDALLLGKGRYVQSLKYLQKKDPLKFAALLNKIGQGSNWTQALAEVFGLSMTALYIRTFWFAYGYSILALLIIIVFAWLGKMGYLIKILHSLNRYKFS